MRSAAEPGAISPASRRLRRAADRVKRSKASSGVEILSAGASSSPSIEERVIAAAIALNGRAGVTGASLPAAICTPASSKTARAIKVRYQSRLGGIFRAAIVDEAGIGNDPRAERCDPLRIFVRAIMPPCSIRQTVGLERALIDVAPRGPDRIESGFKLFDFGHMKGDIETLRQRSCDRRASGGVSPAGEIRELDAAQMKSARVSRPEWAYWRHRRGPVRSSRQTRWAIAPPVRRRAKVRCRCGPLRTVASVNAVMPAAASSRL